MLMHSSTQSGREKLRNLSASILKALSMTSGFIFFDKRPQRRDIEG